MYKLLFSFVQLMLGVHMMGPNICSTKTENKLHTNDIFVIVKLKTCYSFIELLRYLSSSGCYILLKCVLLLVIAIHNHKLNVYYLESLLFFSNSLK